MMEPAIRLTGERRAAACERKPSRITTRVTNRKTASIFAKSDDLPSNRVWVDKRIIQTSEGTQGGRSGAQGVTRVASLLRRRLAKKGGGRLRFGAAVCPGEDRSRSLLDFCNRNRSSSQEADHNLDPTRDGTITPPPTPDFSRPHTEQLGDALLREAKHTERRAEFDHSRAACFHVKLHRHNLPDSRQRQTADGVWMPPTLMDSRDRWAQA
jgi:hypothetical protein